MRGNIADHFNLADFGKYSLTAQEKKALEDYEHNNVKYGDFSIGNDLFDIHPTQSYGLTNPKLFKNAGHTPVVGNTSTNNGIGGYVALAPTEKGNTITYTDTTTSNGIFYQPYDFIGYSHIQGLYPLNDVVWSENSLLFFVTIFKTMAEDRFDYVIKFNRDNAKAMTVKLPIDENGKIDFKYMDDFIEAIKKKFI